VEQTDQVFVTELSTGQMLEDVQAIVGERRPVSFYGRVGGMVMGAEELAEQIEQRLAGANR
jgi:2-oxoglutarate ferredoxin oxidoreductase subunit alpha